MNQLPSARKTIFNLLLLTSLVATMLAPTSGPALAAKLPEAETANSAMTPGLQEAIAETLGVEAAPTPNAPFFAETKLTVSDGEAGDYYGYSVDIDGDTAVVGARGTQVNGTSYGTAYVYDRSQVEADTWVQVKKLTIFDAQGDIIFASVAIHGDTVVVGAIGSGDCSNSHCVGAAYVYYRNQGGPDNWGQVTKLMPSDTFFFGNHMFGFSIALDGDTLVVGAHWAPGELTDYPGAAYVFYRNQGGTDNWGEVAKLISADEEDGDEFGWSVAVDGNTILIGAWGNDDVCPSIPNCNSGSAYIFERDLGGTDNWGQAAKLYDVAVEADDGYSYAVAIQGDTALVGAPGDNDNGRFAGSVYVYDRNQGGANNWGQETKLLASDGTAEDIFGCSVDFSGDIALIGAAYDDDNGEDSGSVYVFKRRDDGTGIWNQAAKLTASDGESHDRYGESVALSGNTAIIGAWLDDDACILDPDCNSGAVYVYELTNPDTIGVYDPSASRFKLRNTNYAGPPHLDFTFAPGIANGIPLTGDWDADGLDTIGVFDPLNGEFHLRNSNDAGPADLLISSNALKGAVPIAGDWDGDGVDTVGIYKNGQFLLRNSLDIGPPDLKFPFGAVPGIPLTGDWDGDGVDTIGLYHPASGEFQFRNTNDTGPADITFSHDSLKNITPLTGDWDGDGLDTLGVYRNGTFYLRNTLDFGPPDLKFTFGGVGLLPLAGDWDG